MVAPIVIPDASKEPAAYVEALLATLGDRDPLEVYAATPARVRELCAGLDDAAWTEPMAPGEWSALQVVGHLFDVDVVYGFRWRLALTEDSPTYPGYDEKRWSELTRPAPRALLAAFAGLREANLALLAGLDEEQLRRDAIHAEQGREDLRRMIDKVAGHDLAHANQLERTVAAAAARAT
jgi:DinB superfamily